MLSIAVGCTRVPAGRYAIDRIDVQGATVISSSEIEEKIATAATPRFLGLFRGVVLDYELFDRYVLERDLTRIERFYRARGYYDAHVRAGRVEQTEDAHVRVEVVVEEGPVVKIGEVRLDGLTALAIDDSAAALAAVRRLRRDRPFEEERFEAAEDHLKSALADRGYAFAVIEAHAEVDLVRRVADITFRVEPKKRAKLGTIELAGLGGLPEEPVRRALDLTPGDWYSESKLESARRAVLALGVFSDADVSAVLTEPDSGVVPVQVRLVSSSLRAVKVGGGIELDQVRADVHLTLGWEDKNFLGGLRRLLVDNRPGLVFEETTVPRFRPPSGVLPEDRSRFELRQPGFIEPRTGGTVRGEFNIYPVLFASSGDAIYKPNLGYRDLSSGVGLDRTFGPLNTSIFYNFQMSVPFGYHTDLPDGFKHIMLSYVELMANLDFRDSLVHPHAGVFLGNNLQIAKNPFISSSAGGTLLTNDWRIQSEVRGYLPVSRRITFAVRALVGFLFPSSYGGSLDTDSATTADIQQVYFRGFFSGGPNSNRGYAYRGVGPKRQATFLFSQIGNVSSIQSSCFLLGPDSNECRAAIMEYCKGAGANPLVCQFPTGGLSLWEASAEVRFPIARSFEGAVFCDASDVSSSRFNLRWLYPHLSCGVGVHYDTPVGPLRLDVGYQLPGLQVLAPNPDPTEQSIGSPIAISIAIGEAF